MEEKIFELMEKMYIEFKDFKVDVTEKFGNIDAKIGSMDAKIGNMDAKIGSMDAKIGNMDAKIGSMDAKIGNMDAKIGNMDVKIGNMDVEIGSLRKDVLRIENKLDTNSKALFDGYSQTYEKLTVLEAKVDDISSKVEKQDVEIRVIKAAK